MSTGGATEDPRLRALAAALRRRYRAADLRLVSVRCWRQESVRDGDGMGTSIEWSGTLDAFQHAQLIDLAHVAAAAAVGRIEWRDDIGTWWMLGPQPGAEDDLGYYLIAHQPLEHSREPARAFSQAATRRVERMFRKAIAAPRGGGPRFADLRIASSLP